MAHDRVEAVERALIILSCFTEKSVSSASSNWPTIQVSTKAQSCGSQPPWSAMGILYDSKTVVIG